MRGIEYCVSFENCKVRHVVHKDVVDADYQKICNVLENFVDQYFGWIEFYWRISTHCLKEIIMWRKLGVLAVNRIKLSAVRGPTVPLF